VTLLRLLGDDGALITVISATGKKTYSKKMWNWYNMKVSE